MRKYYIPYCENTNVNYIYLLYIYGLADFDVEKRIYNTINYKSANQLTELINQIYGANSISKSTIQKMLNENKYNDYFTVNKQDKKIILKNDFKNQQHNKFIVITEYVFNFLLAINDNFLCCYLFYLIYFCGNRETDSTAKQILKKIGYSEKSHDNISKCSYFNLLLVDNGIISIRKYRDENGNERNIYRLCDKAFQTT